MEADLVCGNGDRKAILDNVQKLLDGHERIVAVTPHQRGELFEELPVERFETHTRAFIKVEDGSRVIRASWNAAQIWIWEILSMAVMKHLLFLIMYSFQKRECLCAESISLPA